MSDIYRAPAGATQPGAASGSVSGTRGADAGAGWVTFAGVMLLIVGVMNIIYGIAAIDNSSFYTRDAHYIVSSLNTWGWILLVVGAIQCLIAFGIWSGNQLARWLGVFVAGVNAIIQLLFLPAYPFLALALFSIDLLVVYGLVAYGGRRVAA